MANLRANTIAGSGGSGNNTKASLYLDGTDEYLSFADSADFAMGTGDLTAECWFYVESNVDYRSIIDARDAAGDTDGWMIGVKADGNVYVYAAGWLLITTSAEGTIKTWHHVAYVRKDGTHTLYLDGVSKATSTTSKDYTTQKFAVGTTPYSLGGEEFKGYISSVNLVKGTALYTSNFDPYEVSPKVLSDTVLLCCNDSQKPEAYEVSPGVITPGGTPTPSKFIPSNLAVPTGPTFNGDTKVNTQGYMYFPTGDTTQRGRGRAVYGGGADSPNASLTKMVYIEIQSAGNTVDFGSLTGTNRAWIQGLGSSTRGIWFGGADYGGSNKENTIDYVTIATTGDATDFGDSTKTTGWTGSVSNDTRGVNAGGYPSGNTNAIDYITIASIGNAADFGDLTGANRGLCGMSSPTRGVFAGGYVDPAVTNVIQYITIATTGNATDFGDLLAAGRHDAGGAVFSQTRGVVCGAYGPTTNAMEYITIATTGNALDFGDLLVATAYCGGVNNTTRGVVSGSFSPSKTNTMNYITIATLGNSLDFGDNTSASVVYGQGGTSDSHGGLSE